MRCNVLTLLNIIDPARHVLLAGPTASGKSALALAVAAEQGGCIVNADALQVFANWRVLTARPTQEDEALAPHRLYGHVAADAAYSVGHWLREVSALLDTGQRLIIVGGTGLYLTALTEGLVDIPAIPAAIRVEADARMADPAALLAELDPATRNRIDPGNPARIQRAWEVLRATGRGLADWQAETGPPLLPLPQTTTLALMPDRDWLGARIDRRFDAMIAGGALDEVRAALPGWVPGRPSSRAIGAAELLSHLRGEQSLLQAVALARIASRQYAKRQMTWFRARMRGWHNLALPGAGS